MLNSINTNLAAYSAQGNIGKASNSASSSIARLSSGNRIVRAADDVAALSIGTSLRTNVTTLKQALANTAQGSSLLQVADGALSQISEILQRQKAIATQANSGTVSDTERGYLNQEFQALAAQINQIASSTSFSSVNLLDGSLGAAAVPFNLIADTTAGANIHGFTVGVGTNADEQAITGAAFASIDPGETSFVGDLSTGVFAVTADSAASWDITFTFNDVEYSLDDFDATGAGPIVLTNAAGTATLTLTVQADVSDAYGDDATAFATGLNGIFDTATAVAVRAGVTGTDVEAGEMDTLTEGYLAGMAGADIEFRSTTSGSFDIPDFSRFRAEGFGEGAIIRVTINGETYTSNAIVDGNDGDDLGTDDAFGDGNGILRLYRSDAVPQLDYLEIDLTNVTGTIDASTETGMAEFIAALNDEITAQADGLTLQVGAQSTDTLSVNISSVSTSDLYLDATGTLQTLDVSTLGGAQAASDILDLAIGVINQTRASIGALQSRVDFTAANLQSSIQNQDAARGTLLDTDVAAESTAYATAQVQLQAGIAVLAQANLLPQNLLKLIG